jgi:hypothetical protein
VDVVIVVDNQDLFLDFSHLPSGARALLVCTDYNKRLAAAVMDRPFPSFRCPGSNTLFSHNYSRALTMKL